MKIKDLIGDVVAATETHRDAERTKWTDIIFVSGRHIVLFDNPIMEPWAHAPHSYVS